MKKDDYSAGDYPWLTVVSPDQPNGPELLLEPNDNPVAISYQRGIPATIFEIVSAEEEYRRRKVLGIASPSSRRR